MLLTEQVEPELGVYQFLGILRRDYNGKTHSNDIACWKTPLVLANDDGSSLIEFKPRIQFAFVGNRSAAEFVESIRYRYAIGVDALKHIAGCNR